MSKMILVNEKDAKKVLEALVVAWQQNPHWQVNEAITALRSAIEQMEKQEPVGEMQNSSIIEGAVVPVVPVALPAGTKLFATPPAAQPASQTEWIEDACARIKAADDAAADGDYMLDSDDCIAVLRGEWKGPMLNDMPQRPAAQQDSGLQALNKMLADYVKQIDAAQRQPLTWEQVNDMWLEAINVRTRLPSHVVYARAIEAAHGIGEKK